MNAEVVVDDEGAGWLHDDTLEARDGGLRREQQQLNHCALGDCCSFGASARAGELLAAPTTATLPPITAYSTSSKPLITTRPLLKVLLQFAKVLRGSQTFFLLS